MKKIKSQLLPLLTTCALVGTSLAASAKNDSYCLAIRGNGEAEPAHWGAMARTVEVKGLPAMMSGGSSATISMFWLESIAMNPEVANHDKEAQKERASLLLKSLLGFFNEVKDSQEFKDMLDFFGRAASAQNAKTVQDMQKLLSSKDFATLKASISRAAELGFINREFLELMWKAVQTANVQQAQFYLDEMKMTLAVFGSFNAATDDNLFLRSGVVNFAQLATNFDKVAHFLSGQGADSQLQSEWADFVGSCAQKSVGKTWNELTTNSPDCKTKFQKVYRSHFSRNTNPVAMENQVVGATIPSLPTTSVLMGNEAGGASRYAQDQLQAYHQAMSHNFGKNFQVPNPEQVRFGYWGSDEVLQKIDQTLDKKTDEKSRRFLALGPATWKKVLSLSPAEPGLAHLQLFKTKGEVMVSAGGWSDLHPVKVLKAAGCEDVIYLTRQGGESLFAQGIAKKLLGFDRDWSLLDTSKQAAATSGILNSQGDPSDQNSTWSRLYNLANPSSAINQSLNEASAVLCTNWNDYDVKNQIVELIENSYKSSFLIHSGKTQEMSELSPVMTQTLPGCRTR